MDKKTVLMFCPKFFGYEKRVAQAIRAEGFEVDLYDERPSNSFFAKAFLRLKFKPYGAVVRKYIKGIIEQNKDKDYDYVFVVKSEAAGKKEIDLLRSAYPNAEFILYLWDSVANVPDGEKKLSLYDRVLTFDPVDAKEYNLKLRPLFFSEEYEGHQQNDENEFVYDFSFIGTAHTERPLIAKKLAEDCSKRGTKAFCYLFMPHRLVYLYNKFTNKSFKSVKAEEIKYQPLTASKITEIYKMSRCILDVEHKKQRGLTMRTIEMLGMGKKIITTNKHIKEYDFYEPNNIYLIDRYSPKVDAWFWNSEYTPIKKEVFERYTIKSFVRELFGVEE